MSVIGTLFIAGAMAVYCDKKMEECYAAVAMILSWILYIPGIYFSLIPGIVFYYILLAISAGYLLFVFRSRRVQFRKNIVTPGTLFLLICIIFFLFYSVGRGIDHSDDFYYWNLRIKNMVYFGKMKGVPNTQLGDHPPFTALWDYLAVMTWHGEASQGICLWAQNVLMMSFVVPLFSVINGKFKIIKTLLASVITLLIPTIIDDAYHTLLTDLMLGAMIFFCFYMFWNDHRDTERFNMLCFVLGSISIAMTKRTGSVFMVVILVVCFQSKNAWIHKKMLLLAGLGSAIALFSWAEFCQPFFIAILGMIGSFVYGIIGRGIRNAFENKKGNVVIAVFSVCVLLIAGDYIYSHLDEDLSFGKHVWEQMSAFPKPSFIESVIDLLVIGGLLIWIHRARVDNETQNDIISMGVSYLICMMSYCILMWYLEITAIGPANGGVGGLSVRYFIPLLIPLYLTTLFLFLKFNDTYVIPCLVGMTFLVHAYSDYEMATQNLLYKKESIEFYEFEKNGITLTPQDHVYLIDEKDDYVYTDRAFYNYICPARSQFGSDYNYLINDSGGVMKQTKDEFESLLEAGGYDYVYIQLITPTTTNQYASVFDGMDKIGNGRLYAVRYDGDGIHLEWLRHDS